MASRWRAWDMECLDSILIATHENGDRGLISAVGKEREFNKLPARISSIVLPKAAFVSESDTSDNAESKLSKQCGRGRSLKNRALSQDQPGRRPGEKDKTSLGSKFLGSEYLYEELFPGLNETSAPTVGQKSRSLKDSRTKPSQQENTSNFAKVASESRLPKTGHPPLFATPKSCTKNQTSFPNNFPQEAHHSDNTANSIESKSQNAINQSSFRSANDSTTSKATSSKTCFRQINLARNPVAVPSKMKSTSFPSVLSVKENRCRNRMSHSATPIVPCVEPIPEAKTKKSLEDCKKKGGKGRTTPYHKPTSEDKQKQSKNPDTSTLCLVEVRTKSHVNDESKSTKNQVPTQLAPKSTSETPTDLFENEHCPPKSATESAAITGVTNSADINNQVTSLQDTSGTQSIDYHNIPTKSMDLSEIGYPSQLSTDSLADESTEQANVQHQSTQQPRTSISDSLMLNSVTCNDHNTNVSQDDHQSVSLGTSHAEENPQMLITSSVSTQEQTNDCFNNHDELTQPLCNTARSDDSHISNTEALPARMSNTTGTAKDHVANNDKRNWSSSRTPGHDSEKQPEADDGSCSVVGAFTEVSGKGDTDCSAMSLDIDEQSNHPPSTFDNGASAKLLSDLYHESIQTPGQLAFEDKNETSIIKQQSTEPLNTVDRSIQQQENSDINGERESAYDRAMDSHLDTINSSLVSNCNLLSSHIGGTLDINAHEKPSIAPKLNQDTNEERNCRDEEKKPLEEAGLEEKPDCEEMSDEPCDVKLENLPLTFTEEDLVEIIEPYGTMISCTFLEESSIGTSKTTIVRMTDQISGEWLAASLDGLEIDDHRMQTTIVEV